MAQLFSIKQYVDCICLFNTAGEMIPKSIVWTDGREFEITHILDVRRKASLKAGGAGIRYKVVICGEQRELYFEDFNFNSLVGGKWFVESKPKESQR